MKAEQPSRLGRMSRDEFRRWLLDKPSLGRFERVNGEPVAMAPERAVHVRVKLQIWSMLAREIKSRGLDCEAFGDGMTVEVGEDTDYEPDAVVNCGPRIPDHEVAAPNPLIVVEVESPSTSSTDLGTKLADYFRVPVIRHYLIVRTKRQSVIHHRRTDDGRIETAVLSIGSVTFDPPGITLEIDEIYGTTERRR